MRTPRPSPGPRLLFGLAALYCGALLAFALVYVQGVERLDPCPLCVVQRIAYLLCALVGVLGVWLGDNRTAVRLLGGLLGLFALAGAVVAGHQLWLLYYGDPFSCGISPEERLLTALPLAGWWPQMFDASGSCLEANWVFLGLPIAAWSLLAFLPLVLLGLVLLLRAPGGGD